MEVLGKTISSIAAQNLLGWIVIVVILAVFILGVVLSIKLKKYYNKLDNDVVASRNSAREVYFEHEELNKALKRFKKSTESGTDNINTQVVIEKNLKRDMVKREGILKLIPAILIALGLLGTFLGLTLAIFETKTALGGINTINNFTKQLQAPIASMATAFWTSIFGVSTSMVLNFIIQSFKDSKNSFYNEFEDYLDNEVFADHAKTFNTIFEEFSKTVKFTMLTLTEEMTNLFKDGVDELVNKINASSIDLTNSANGLAEYTKEFKILVQTFDNTVKGFEKPVAIFDDTVRDFVLTSNTLSTSVDEGFSNFVKSFLKMETSMKILSSNIDTSFEAMSKSLDMTSDNLAANLGQCFTGFNKGLEVVMDRLNTSMESGLDNVSRAMISNTEGYLEVAATIKDEADSMIINQENIKDLIEEVKQNNLTNNKDVAYQTVVLNKQSKELEECIKLFNRSVEHMPLYVAERFTKVLKDYLDDVGINIKNHIDSSLGTISTDILGASRTLDETINIIDSSRDIIKKTGTHSNNMRSRSE